MDGQQVQVRAVESIRLLEEGYGFAPVAMMDAEAEHKMTTDMTVAQPRDSPAWDIHMAAVAADTGQTELEE